MNNDYPYWNCEYVYNDGDVVQYNNQLCMMWQGKAVPFIQGATIQEMVQYCQRKFIKPIPPYPEKRKNSWLQKLKDIIPFGNRT